MTHNPYNVQSVLYVLEATLVPNSVHQAHSQQQITTLTFDEFVLARVPQSISGAVDAENVDDTLGSQDSCSHQFCSPNFVASA
jgi:hypothetical protein